MMNTTSPERLYRGATEKTERRALQAAVVEKFRMQVADAVPPSRAAQQAGAIGVLIALERWAGDGDFWAFAAPFVDDEVRRFLTAFPDAEVIGPRYVAGVELEDGRQVEVELRTGDGRPATRGELKAALGEALWALSAPIED